MHLTRRGLLGAVGAAGVCGVAGTAVGRRRARQADEEMWTTSYDAGRVEYADAAARRGDAVLLAGRSIGQETTAYWTLAVGSDGEKRPATTFERETQSTVDAVVPTPEAAVVAGIDLGPEDAVTAPWTPWVSKVGQDGVEWTYGKDEVEEDYRVSGTARTNGGDYVIVGSRGIYDPDPWILRLAEDGSVIQERSLDRDRPAEFWDVTAVGDGEIVVGGTVGESRESSALLLRIDSDGDTRWDRTYDDADGVGLTRVRSVATDGDGVALALDGHTDGDAGPTVGWADGEGSLEQATYLFPSQASAAESVVLTDAGYLVGGNFVLEDSVDDYWLAAVDRNGSVRWQARYDDGGYFGDLLGDGAYALFAGGDGEDATLHRFDSATVPRRNEARSASMASEQETTEAATDRASPDTADGGTTPGDASTEETATSGTPGFGVGEAIAGSAALALIRRRRCDD
ncbi:hypothetical protein [Halostella pelagica]|uniref:hypothetical protein n=1 Tax=Halostella pelagica TaxID=2583824 RepID=UPI001081ACD5|nr:hypothetical protein [Halostella pelagica]